MGNDREERSSRESPDAGDIPASTVFAVELDHVLARWRRVYERRDTDGSGANRRLSKESEPAVANDLVGLALSGGGVRAATFHLGVVQALHRRGLLDHVDFLSAVGGGSFLGSSLAALMKDGGDFPFEHREGYRESPFLTWLRNRAGSVATPGFGRLAIERLRGLVVHFVPLVLLLLSLAFLGVLWVESSLPFPDGWTARWLMGLPTTLWVALGLVALHQARRLVFKLKRRDERPRLRGGLILLGVAAAIELLGFLVAWGVRFEEPEIVLGSVLLPALVAIFFLIGRPILKNPVALWMFQVAGLVLSVLVTLAVAALLYAARPTLAVFLGDAPGEAFYPVAVLAAIFFAWLAVRWMLSGNDSSILRFLREALARAYLVRSVAESARSESAGSESDEPAAYDDLRGGDRQPLSEVCGQHSSSPYLLISAALNLHGSRTAAKHGQHRQPFLFSTSFYGSDATGYCETRILEAVAPRLDLAMASAISASREIPGNVAPETPAQMSLSAIANLRPGYWLPNPVALARRARRTTAGALSSWPSRLAWRVPVEMTLREVAGRLHERGRWVNVAGGGHVDDLALYELLRRRCRYVLVSDAGTDKTMAFSSLVALIRKARVEGIEIEIELDDLRPNVGEFSRRHCAFGRIFYPPEPGEEERRQGYLIYVKASVTGDESDEIKEYRARNAAFPHEAGGRWKEAQFESYRALGFHATCELFQDLPDERPVSFEELARWFRHFLGESAPRPRTVQDMPEPPAALVDAIVAEEAILFAGAGLGAHASFPTWQPFVRGLLELALERRFLDADFADSLAAAIDEGEIDQVADNVVSAFEEHDPSVLRAHLEEIFEREVEIVPEIHGHLGKLPFSAAFTTNFDGLLEKTFGSETPVHAPADAEALLDKLSKRERFVLKLYGALDRPETVMIAPAQYKKVIEGNKPFARFMETVFFSRTLLFLGASLDGIGAYLGGIDLPDTIERRHYALVDVRGRAWRSKANLLARRYGIEVLPFTASDGYPEVPLFLDKLSTRVHEAKPSPDGESGPAVTRGAGGERLRLTRIRLRDIGPFEELELDLDTRSNILLGDNGVGKSSILRAIATAIIGEDAAPWADRLIRTGKTVGKIVLDLEGRKTYKTVLRKDSRGAQVECIPGRPLEAEGWLAIGFPPLRTFSWKRPENPEAMMPRRPSPDDLMPLIRNVPDPRVDGLKQWVVNLDWWRKDELSRNAGDGRYQELLNKFFEVVNFLTAEDETAEGSEIGSGLRISLQDIHPQTREITILTDDGPVPIESLSQGTSSLIGWLGITLQRLYEVAPPGADPLEQYALLLMDEIDAHLHPAWQRRLIGRLLEVFPKLQIIATTHSPLVVAGRDIETVFRFVRDDSGVVLIEPPADATMGRTDQILLGQLFDLEEVIDPETVSLLARYRRELTKSVRDETKLAELKKRLGFRLPYPESYAPRRRAFELVEMILQEKIGVRHPEQNEEVLERAGQLLDDVLIRRAET